MQSRVQSRVQSHLLQLLLGRERGPRAHAAARGDAPCGSTLRTSVRGEGRRGLAEGEECARAALNPLISRSVEVMLQLITHLRRAWGEVEGGWGGSKIKVWGGGGGGGEGKGR